MFFFWNNGRLIINVNNIKTITVAQENSILSKDRFATIVYQDYGTLGIDREIYDHLINFIISKGLNK